MLNFFSLYLEDNCALPGQFQQNFIGRASSHNYLSEIVVYYRMRDAARRAALFILARYGEGDLAVFPRDLIRLIANEVWKTREDPMWMKSDA